MWRNREPSWFEAAFFWTVVVLLMLAMFFMARGLGW